MSPTIVVGYDGEDAADRARDRAIAEGPQNFGTLYDSPARMIPLV